jgi:phage-related protein
LVGALVRNIPKLLAAGIELLLGLREGLMDAIPELIKAIPDVIKGIVKALVEGIPDLLEAGKDMLEGLFEGFLDPDVIWEKVKSLGESIVDAAKSFFGIKSPSKLMREEIGEFLGEGVGVGMLDSLPTVKKNLNKFGDFITDNLGGIKSGLSLGVSGIGGNAGASVGGGRVVNIDARQTLNYNGKMSLKETKQAEREHITLVKTKFKAEGWA